MGGAGIKGEKKRGEVRNGNDAKFPHFSMATVKFLRPWGKEEIWELLQAKRTGKV